MNVGTTHDSNFKILNAVKKKKVGGRESTGRGKVARRPAADTIPVANNGRMMKMRGNRGVPCGAFEGGWWCHKRKVQFRLSQSAKLPLLHCLLGPAVPNNSPCSKFGKQQQKKKVGKKKKKKNHETLTELMVLRVYLFVRITLPHMMMPRHSMPSRPQCASAKTSQCPPKRGRVPLATSPCPRMLSLGTQRSAAAAAAALASSFSRRSPSSSSSPSWPGSVRAR